MGLCDLFPITLLVCFPAFFIKFSYSNSDSYPSFEDCSPSVCNNSTIRYPFQIRNHGTCNGLAFVGCHHDRRTSISDIYIQGLCHEYQYIVLGEIKQSSYSTRTIRIALHTHLDDCSAIPACLTTPDPNLSHFYLSDKHRWGTILVCRIEPPSYTANFQQIQCLHCRNKNASCFFLPSISISEFDDDGCSKYSVVIPADKDYSTSDEKNLLKFLQMGFEITWRIDYKCQKCQTSGGRCYTSHFHRSSTSACICADGPHGSNCLDVIGVLSGIFALATAIIIIIYVKITGKKRKQREEEVRDIRAYMDPLDSRTPSVENFLHGGIPTRYSYRQIKRYTVNFVDRLGHGGFGTVFKGELPNGCKIAVKILDKSKHSHQKHFMNEVVTIGRIHHLHLVRLLGYCFEGSKRALIYEYMVNGSLERYIHGDDQNVLDWKQLYSIAMGTARGIAYLHDGCRSRILHCDIKPHNVLLDASFSPKVADFGLAKLTDREESHVFLTDARGTPGYVAPEVWSRNNGPVSDKSDVYSYGMLVMEMAGGRKNFDMQVTRSSTFYYPNWAFKQVEMGEFRIMKEGNIADDENENIATKMTLLGLWCIQYNPCQRPSMSRVIQMLEGTIDIAIPPRPFPFETSVQTIASTESSSCK
ncbi:hypothetical protein KI387_043792 [Taxus chinensis]|uniref:Protein kinase domain-containing protein n=1 Tax=Taxus chinensis TaxID=29808 RepID=A0AA38FMU7_TAXCH|nr:hypothetical protein KI387_043792 [Taxus chinensis]